MINFTKDKGPLLVMLGLLTLIGSSLLAFGISNVDWGTEITGTQELIDIQGDNAIIKVMLQADTIIDINHPGGLQTETWKPIYLEGFVGEQAGIRCVQAPDFQASCSEGVKSSATQVQDDSLKNINIKTGKTKIDWNNDWQCIGDIEQQFTQVAGLAFQRFHDCTFEQEITVPISNSYEGNFICNTLGTSDTGRSCDPTSELIQVNEIIPMGIRYSWDQFTILGISNGEITSSATTEVSGNTVIEIPNNVIETEEGIENVSTDTTDVQLTSSPDIVGGESLADALNPTLIFNKIKETNIISIIGVGLLLGGIWIMLSSTNNPIRRRKKR